MTERFKRRLDVAQERLEATALLLEEGFPADAVSRAYYAVYEAARVLREVRPATHKGVENQLGHRFRDEAINLQPFSRLRTDRQRCDYELNRPEASRAQTHLADARTFVEQPETLIDEKT